MIRLLSSNTHRSVVLDNNIEINLDCRQSGTLMKNICSELMIFFWYGMYGFTLALSSYFDFIYRSLYECCDKNQYAIIQITTNDESRGRLHVLCTRSGGAIVTKQYKCSSWICHPGGAVTHAL
jgi:hypothetical protein